MLPNYDTAIIILYCSFAAGRGIIGGIVTFPCNDHYRPKNLQPRGCNLGAYASCLIGKTGEPSSLQHHGSNTSLVYCFLPSNNYNMYVYYADAAMVVIL